MKMHTDELIELGLVKSCSHVELSQSKSGEIFRDFCGTPTLVYGGKCSKHSQDLEFARQAKAEVAKNAAIHRAMLEDEVLPLAHQRVMRILNDPESKDADVIKIWQTTMDRVGLAAVSGLVVEGNVTVDAPLDILRRMLSANPSIEQNEDDAEVEEAEIVDDSE